ANRAPQYDRQPQGQACLPSAESLVVLYQLRTPGNIGVSRKAAEPTTRQQREEGWYSQQFTHGHGFFGDAGNRLGQPQSSKTQYDSGYPDQEKRETPAERGCYDPTESDAGGASKEHAHVEGPLHPGSDFLWK